MDKDKLKIASERGTRMHDNFMKQHGPITISSGTSYDFGKHDDLIAGMTYIYGVWPLEPKGNPNQLINLNLSISKVIFHDPATIIYWSDNTRTVVKCSKDDIYDPEKGMAMAICKKILGYRFKEIFKEYLPKEETTTMYADNKTIKSIRVFNEKFKVKD